jgi:hypothetical protein
MPELPNVKIDHDLGGEPEDVRLYGPRRWAAIDSSLPKAAPNHHFSRIIGNRYRVEGEKDEEEMDREARHLMERAKINLPYRLGVYQSGPYVNPLVPTPGERIWEGIQNIPKQVVSPVMTGVSGGDSKLDEFMILARAAGYIK